MPKFCQAKNSGSSRCIRDLPCLALLGSSHFVVGQHIHDIPHIRCISEEEEERFYFWRFDIALQTILSASWMFASESMIGKVDATLANQPLVRREAKLSESDLEERLNNALEVAQVAEAAAARASVMVAAQDQRLTAADEKIFELEKENDEQKKELEDVRGDFAKVNSTLASDVNEALNQTNATAIRLQAELAGVQAQEAQLKAKDEILERVVKDMENKVIEFGTEAMRAENAAGHAQNDAGKAKNSSDLLKAREANLKYEVDDLGTTLDEVLKDQNISRKAVQKLLSRTQNLGKTMLKISGNLKKFDGSLSKAVRQAVESDKLAKMAKEEADDALDDVESVGQTVPGFGGGYSRTSTVVGEEGPRGPPGPPGPPGDARPRKAPSSQTRGSPAPPGPSKQGGESEEPAPVRTVVSSVYDPTTAAVAAKQHAKAAWEAVKQIQAQNSKTRPVYEVASMTGDLIQIVKGPPGPQGAPGQAGEAGAKGQPGPPGLALRAPPKENSTDSNSSNATAASKATDVEAPLKKAASLPMYFAAFGASVAILLILYRSIDAIIVTGDLSARAWNKKKKLRARAKAKASAESAAAASAAASAPADPDES
ncbi:unnamed protein product [Symbiodinium natans]|uniref:Uncharacterized protein n=1 Tax=Symbiodinium natans TaxID=878477 RepID=A0A812M4M0_9DINO|nr:unnamed protein product [Symbiodinium natans]